MNALLENPVWASLTSAHEDLAERCTNFLRYPAEIAPFAAVPDGRVSVSAEELIHADPEVYFVGVLPHVTGSGFRATISSVLQMGVTNALSSSTNSIMEEVQLSRDDNADMMELTTAAFPGFFRPRTGELGKYLGIRRQGQLVAMAGERMRMPGLREISAICTRPGFTGQGFAKHLVQRLLSSEDEAAVFLHVGATNTRAVEIYRSLGFEVRSTVDILHLVRSN
jgi:ribosomal protein S18 acetylase RimI-like enzyme